VRTPIAPTLLWTFWSSPALLESHRAPQVTVAWQGGEPTLMFLVLGGYYLLTVLRRDSLRQRTNSGFDDRSRRARAVKRFINQLLHH
jgi:hypothetical protein